MKKMKFIKNGNYLLKLKMILINILIYWIIEGIIRLMKMRLF